MKKLTQKAIEQVKSLTYFSKTKFHGNTKKVGALTPCQIKIIVAKKFERMKLKNSFAKLTPIQEALNVFRSQKKYKGTPYFKIMVEGNTGIYLASPIYLHSDYNKTRIFDKNEKNLKIMELFNIINNK